MIQIKWQTKQGSKIVSRNIPENMVEVINQIKREIAKDVSTMMTVTVIWQLDNKRRGLKGRAKYSFNLTTKKITKVSVYIFDNAINSNQDMRETLVHEFGHIKDYLMGRFLQSNIQAEYSADEFVTRIYPEYKRGMIYGYSNKIPVAAKRINKSLKGK